ncbi:PTS sugar transporter subunit IIB [Mycoplasmopsis pullorum]|uniref:PTS galactitol transporter subunit IIB n=1 Tax=Mycoplasmopsis pullorum TaxID=48003 RepID=A0A1L4FSW6_9BACT|nr:PTS sugar transporter subunit IIB [Mycoplasmopsis pullorum]APJ38672.1 PTS galactitol transporter subunit IIB [Mycoplasmopsis pullorum]TNK82196.1 PTS galactitol transporter subunit IIB [Mycoplasmopsis pullorum]TNK83178.1 PTS galactitol transporter subunit IIB [Mycoplasmopsis pullorum]TNK84676.1 PTS galactitol transporter subunit IIB [Mycoplasmopsis pullorum]TNK85463.1 PTS galactitol transporter subunit IIB [Mycoplasmopsis pullorum]
MVIQTVCGSGLGSSLLVEMNTKMVLDSLGVEYDSVEHTNVSSFTGNGVDYVVVGADVAPALDFPEERKIVLINILSKDELTQKLKEKLGL